MDQKTALRLTDIVPELDELAKRVHGDGVAWVLLTIDPKENSIVFVASNVSSDDVAEIMDMALENHRDGHIEKANMGNA